MRLHAASVGIAACLALSGCGTALPTQDFRNPGYSQFNTFVAHIATHVRCELRQAVKLEYDEANPKRAILRRWAAKIALTIRALDRSILNPSTTVMNTPMDFTFVASGRFQADATRELTMTYFIPFDDLITDKPFVDAEGKARKCSEITGDRLEPIAGDLGIHQTLAATLQAWDGNRTLSEAVKGGPFETISHRAAFIIQADGNANPTLEFRLVATGSPTNLLGLSRTQTDELLITMGPAVLNKDKLIAPSDELNASFNIERFRGAFVGRSFPLN